MTDREGQLYEALRVAHQTNDGLRREVRQAHAAYAELGERYANVLVERDTADMLCAAAVKLLQTHGIGLDWAE